MKRPKASGSVKANGLVEQSRWRAGAGICAYEDNGDVVALVNLGNGTETARYEYGPFGEPIRITGPVAPLNPFRFSTKRTCNTTDLALYEYRTYSPSLGRWPNRDPIGELGFKTLRRKCTRGFASAGNLYGFVGNNPLNSFDVFGLYEYEWEGAFTEAEKQAIKDSIHRVRDRANALIKQIDDNIKNLKRCPCPAYDELAKKLEGLKKILQGMVKEIDDPGWNLEVYKKNMPGRDAEYWNSPVPWLDDELRLNPSWFGQGTIDQDTTMFHEITHGQGTVDDDVSNPYNNAHALEGLMHTDKENWIYFKFDKQDADKKCNPAGK